MAQDQGGSGGGSGGGDGGETVAERNARLQAAFDAAQAASTPAATDTPYYPPTSYMTPDVPVSAAPDVPQWTGTSDTVGVTPGPQFVPAEDIVQHQASSAAWFYSQGNMPQAGTPQTNWGDFYSQNAPQAPAQTSWTEQELEMLGGMSVQDAINWGANYTGQALFGGWNALTGEPYTGAFDMETGELVNPSMMPSLLSPEFAHAMGLSEEQRMMMGYNPEYPYELQDIPAGSGGGYGYGGGGGGYGGGYSPSGGYGYSSTGRWGLTNWRIG